MRRMSAGVSLGLRSSRSATMLKALQSTDPRTVTTTPPPAMTPLRQR